MTATIESLSAATFDEEIRAANVPVLVEIWAEWCPPCKALLPVLESIAAGQGERLRIYKINGDDHPQVSTRFGVMAVPTLLLFNDGELVKKMVGAKGKGHLLQELGPFLT